MESFQWLAQEVQQTKGEALVMKVEKFEGLRDSDLIKLFHHECKQDYEEIDHELDNLEKKIARKDSEQPRVIKENLERLRNQFFSISAADFFNSAYGNEVLSKLNKFQEKLLSKQTISTLPSLDLKSYKNKVWVTRPRPHVDRLGCAWLIRRFIDPNAKIRYSNDPKTDEVSFDMKGALLSHYQNLCSFETMLAAFHLQDLGLKALAEIIHEIDLKDSKYFHPETECIALILKGWLHAGFTDEALESHGIALFEGLYQSLNRESFPKKKRG